MNFRAWIADLAGGAIAFFARAVTAVQPVWTGIDPAQVRQRVYFANHASHGDFVLIWAALPPALRRSARPVAGADYWDRGDLRRFIGRDVFNALLIARNAEGRSADPVEQMDDVLDDGSSLILFPEGTRNLTEEVLLPFKSGLFHLARTCPEIEMVPVWIENLNRVLPKGAVVPVPLMCKVVFGAPMHLEEDEEKDEFLTRTRNALLALNPKAETRG
ncbi:1-acyl-sn-glycerol-3-phosphate acyltransferase [Paracoccus caeni]|uniref:1-acyl-sn-glycerol-3-phosphate acyltransferase n=1 Tax=Paracoccus caeni TaxID=657651 RepID=A0A934SEA6_9RHOB|nr:lysophospholipid acyltransferase family protein [Paracoccus caeni]MBK4215381.1 1-acyl-sn-glycerol-3-phosphate acyltransferase [Paracoccus caeni]